MVYKGTKRERERERERESEYEGGERCGWREGNGEIYRGKKRSGGVETE